MSRLTKERLDEIEERNFLWDEHRDYELLGADGLECIDEIRRLRAEHERLAKALAWIVAFNESSETECRLCRGIFHRPECPMPLAYRALNPEPTS